MIESAALLVAVGFVALVARDVALRVLAHMAATRIASAEREAITARLAALESQPRVSVEAFSKMAETVEVLRAKAQWSGR